MAQDKDSFDKKPFSDTPIVPSAVNTPKKFGVTDYTSILNNAFSQPNSDSDNFDKSNSMVEIEFPDDLPADMAALFLILVGATPAAPTNDKSLLGADYANGYMLVANKQVTESFINKYKTPDDLNDDPVLLQFYAALVKCKSKIKLRPWNHRKSNEFLQVLDNAYACNRYIFDRFNAIPNWYTPIHDKINFMYTLCSDIFRIDKLSPKNARKEEIFKHFILMEIERIKNAPTAVEQDVLLDKFMHSIVIETTILQRKWNEFYFTSLGKLKMSKPLSMMVVLDDGSHADFFKLDKDKSYRIMNHVNVAKINQFVDFSNIDVDGGFGCSKAKVPIILPKSIYNLLDCSQCCDNFITPETRFPKGTRVIDLTCTIKSFTDLKNLNLPESVNQIVLAKSLINSVLKDPAKLAEFKSFEEQYPNIKIVATINDKSLQEMLAPAKPVDTKPVTPKAEPKIVETKTVIPAKTSEWLTRKEVLALIEQDSEFSSIEGLDRFIKRAINSSAIIKKENKTQEDGAVVSCVHINCVPTIKQTVLQIIEEDTKRAKPKQIVNDVTPEEAPKAKKAKKQKPVKIAKFISQKVWNDIKNSCNDSAHLIYSVLEHINKVNIDFTKEKVVAGPVKYIDKNGKIQVVPTLHIEDICAITQSIGNRYTGKRIIWTMNSHDNILVAIRFMETHADNTNDAKEYKETRKYAAKVQNTDGENITRDFVVAQGYLNIADLLKQYKPTKTEKKTEEKQPVKTVEQTDTKAEPKAPVVEPATEPVNRVKHSHKKTTQTDDLLPKQSVKTVKQTEQESSVQTDAEQTKATVVEPTTEPAVRAKRPRIKTTQAEVKSLEAEIAAFIEGLDNKIKTLSILMGKQKDDPKKQLETLKEIEHYIQEKINLQRE